MKTIQHFLAPAKLNLFLHITGRRPDGYHTLQSVFVLLDHYDHLSIEITQTPEIKRSPVLENLPETEDLCVRAAKALQTATDCKFGAHIHLEKHIPMGGGLGGGSSDAATTLLALNHLWQLNLDRHQLMEIGLTLGADVPVFLFGQTAWAEGIGEKLSPISLPQHYEQCYFVVVTPKTHVSTADIFRHPGLTRDTKPLKIADFSKNANSELFRNDLENVVCKEFPAVAQTLAWLSQYGEAKMSGSGASVFVAVNSQQTAEKILHERPENTYGFFAKALKYHPHVELTN